MVLENDEVTTRLMGVDDAREAGARALFGEKYGDEVRVVSMGRTAREHGSNALGWSVELCGGTHVRRTGDIGLITVTGESAVASGVRRIEALTGNYARKHANDTMALAKTAAAELRTSIDDVPARIAALMEERKKLERDLSDARKKLAMGGGASPAMARRAGVREVGDVKLMARAVEGIETKDLKSLVDDGKKQIGSGVVAIVGVTEDGKAGIVVGVTADLTSRFNAVELVRKGSEALGGKGGGGRPDMAQAGGPDGAKADAALSAIEQAMAEQNRPARNLATVPGKTRISDPDLRDRLYELLEHDHLPYSVGSRFVQLIVALIVLDVLAMILASVPELDARFRPPVHAIEIARRDGVRAGICGAALERGRAFTARTCRRRGRGSNMPSPASASSICWHSCRRRSRWSPATRPRWCCSACCRSSNWCAIRRRCARCWRRFMPSGARCSAAS